MIPADLRIQADRIGTSRHVKVTHVPSGISAECDDTPSQIKNLHEAYRLLQIKLGLSTGTPIYSDEAGGI